MSEEVKNETIVGSIAKNGGGLGAGAILGGVVLAPAVVWGLGIILAPFTAGVSVGAAAAITAGAIATGAIVGHKQAKKID